MVRARLSLVAELIWLEGTTEEALELILLVEGDDLVEVKSC